MGAGDRKDHYVQDAAEVYLAWRLQEHAETRSVARSVLSADLKTRFDDYIGQRQAERDFERSDYKLNVDAITECFIGDLVSAFPRRRFDFSVVEKEFRDQKKKGDLEMQLDDGTKISISVKNYKNGYRRIQLCSGTWNSFLNNFLFEADGVGIFIDPRDRSRFQGSNRNKRDALVSWLGLSPLLDVYRFIDRTNDEIRAFYVDDPGARMWSDIEARWRDDCQRLGSEAARRLATALARVNRSAVKQRLLAMAGLTFDEELLLIGKGTYLCSITSEPYRSLLAAVNEAGAAVHFGAVGQTLKFSIQSVGGRDLIDIEVPFTLQKNGAWHLPKRSYTGTQMHTKEGRRLAFGERRPKKSRELATSTNTYLDLARVGLVD